MNCFYNVACMINQIRALVVLYKVQKTFTVTEGLSQHIL